MVVETKKAKRLKTISWIILTVVPIIVTIILLIFNFGYSAKGYEEKILTTENKVSLIIPKVEKLESNQLIENIAESFQKMEITKNALEMDKLRETTMLINNNLIKINDNIEMVLEERLNFKEHSWVELQIRLQRMEKTIDSIRDKQ